MVDHVLQGTPDVPILLRRSGRARRISLRISQLDGRVTLTLPNGVPESEALSFARQKESWIRSHLERREDDVPVALGSEIPVQGVTHRVVQGQGRRVVMEDGMIMVPGPVERIGARLKGHFKQMARVRLVGPLTNMQPVWASPMTASAFVTPARGGDRVLAMAL